MTYLTNEQRALLEPWARLYCQLEDRLNRMSDDELGRLHEALSATSRTNCWCAVHRAAQALKPIVKNKCGERTMAKLKAMDQVDSASRHEDSSPSKE